MNGIYTQLQRQMRVAQIESEQLQDELIEYNDMRFSLLRDYLSQENDSNAELQNIVDLMSQDVSGDPRQLISDTLLGSNRSS